MNLKKYRFFIAALAVSAVLTMAGCGTAKEKDADTDTGISQDLSADDFMEVPAPADNSASKMFSEMKTTDLEGNTADASDFAKNKLTLVNVWNVGCTPCIQEIPILDQLNKEYVEKGAAIKGLYHDFAEGITDESREAVNEILSKANADYQQLLLSKEMFESDTMQQLAVYPTTFLVDSEGNIIDTVEGSRDYEGWKRVIEDGLKQVENHE